MKLMKKLLTILFAFMMVLTTTNMVFAEDTEGTSATNKGTLVINGALADHDYKVYRIFELESFKAGNYSYKVENEWKKFFADASGSTAAGAGNAYIKLDENGYIKTTDLTEANKAEFAKKALEYAKDTSNSVTAITDGTGGITKADNRPTENKITYTGLPMGYYLVDSSVGALCHLSTTNLTADITEKNTEPKVEKKVKEDSKTAGAADEYGESNTADIGQEIEFKTTITVGDGAENYVLHDKMTGMTYVDGSIEIKKGTTAFASTTHYTVETTGLTDDCTFHVKFNDYSMLNKGDEIIVTYKAKLNADATVGTAGNENKAWLTFGTKDGKKTTESVTTTKTYSIPVFKFYKDNTSQKIGLADAEFKLSRKDSSTDYIKFVKSTDPTEGEVYRVAKTDETTAVDTIKTVASAGSTTSGKFVIKGLDADEYLLTETTAPKGYNWLKEPVKIKITEEGKVQTLDTAGTTWTDLAVGNSVEIENKTGTLLPSTGGVGTTMMYIVGAALLIGSGVLLITKKNAK